MGNYPRWLTPIGLISALLLGAIYGTYAGGPPPAPWGVLGTVALVVLVALVIGNLVVSSGVLQRQNDPFPLGYECGKCRTRHAHDGACPR